MDSTKKGDSCPRKPITGFRRIDDEPHINVHGELVTSREIFEEDQKRRRREVGTVRKGQPYMMGEGIGPQQWGMAGPRKSTRWSKPETNTEKKARVELEELEKLAKKQRRKEGVKKAKVTRRENKKRQDQIRRKEATGELIVGYRWFLVRFFSKGWQHKWQRLIDQGMFVDAEPWDPADPLRRHRVQKLQMNEVTIICSKFIKSGAICLPVIEERDLAKEQQPKEWMTDRYKRKFTMSLEWRKALGKVFPIDWKRPLLEAEVMQWISTGYQAR